MAISNLKQQVVEESASHRVEKRRKLQTKVTKKRVKRKLNLEALKQVDVEKKQATILTDRITSLPDSLQLHILSYLDTKEAVQTSTLSKQWVSSWTSIPALKFDYGDFGYVNKVLSTCNCSVKLESLSFKRGDECNNKILEKVFSNAFSHGVKRLEALNTCVCEDNHWPITSQTSSDSLTSLILKSTTRVQCPFLGPRSAGVFKNLACLHLERAIISDSDSFSSFPMLEKLALNSCRIITKGNTLNIHALNLSELTISCHEFIACCELTTPKLRFFEYRGSNFPFMKTHKDGICVLDTMVIDFEGKLFYKNFEDLISFFHVVSNAKSLTVFSSIIALLSSFEDILVNRRSLFRDLKALKFDFRHFLNPDM